MPGSLDAHVSETDAELSSQFFNNVIDYLNSKKIKNVLDVGGCTGQVSIVLLEKIPTIESIKILEPVLQNYNYIAERTKDFDKIEVINKALFYGETHIQLGQCDDNVGGWSFKHNGNKTEPVETITLENFESIDFVKIDIEGAEVNVIPNSKGIHKIPYLEIEFHDELLTSWRDYTNEYLTNHELVFDGSPNRPQHGFFVRKDLI